MSKIARYPQALHPLVASVEKSQGQGAALRLAQGLAKDSSTNAHLLTEIAKVHYLRGKLVAGDTYIEMAKQVDHLCTRIYEEEAWNQRARGNLHRERAAVEQLLALETREERLWEWRFWLGDLHLRSGHIEEAWEILKYYGVLPRGSDLVLHAGYCAALLSLEKDKIDAYRRFAPTPAGGYDRYRTARAQLERFGRVEECLRILSEEAEVSSSELVDLKACAQLQNGDLDGASTTLRDGLRRVKGENRRAEIAGMLYEVLGRPGEALRAYQLVESTRLTPLSLFRMSELLHGERGSRAAVEAFLRGQSRSGSEKLSRSADDIDPELERLLVLVRSCEVEGAESYWLEQILLRASGRDLIRVASTSLVRLLARDELWDDAWEVIRKAQLVRLPWVPLTMKRGILESPSNSATYAEWCETEEISQHTVLYESSLGTTTSCNPLAMCTEMLDDPEYSHLLHVWSVSPQAPIHPKLLNRENVVFVRKGSPGYFRYLATAGYIINNSTLEYEFTKREGQRYLNTWHGIPWKHMGRDNQGEPFSYGNISRNFLQADVVLTPDAYTRDVLSRSHEIQEIRPNVFKNCGLPRWDLSRAVMKSDSRRRIRNRLGVDEGGYLVLYLPTWHGSFHDRDARAMATLETAAKLASEDFTVVLRAHHYVSQAVQLSESATGCVGAPPEYDTNELIGAADVVVTDFSSVLFDAAAVGVPVIKLTSGAVEYKKNRGLYFAPEELPGANAPDVEAAIRLLREATGDPEAFVKIYANQTSRFIASTTKSPTRSALELLFKNELGGRSTSQTSETSLRPVLFSTGGLPSNGITTSFRNLVKNLGPTRYVPILTLPHEALEAIEAQTLEVIQPRARILPRVGAPVLTQMERECLDYFKAGRFPSSHSPIRKSLLRGFQREGKRLFGAGEFFAALEFSSYDSYDLALMAHGVEVQGGRRGAILHNEMYMESVEKYPRLKSGFQAAGEFDFIASVSEGVRKCNSETFYVNFGIDKSKHETLQNTLDLGQLQEASKQNLESPDLEWYAKEGTHICVVGRLSPEKNHLGLFQALSSCKDNLSSKIWVTCLGDGVLRNQLERFIAEAGIADLVRIRGLVQNPYPHILAADVLVLPSLIEGQPMVLLEALSLGVPVIATDTPGSSSVLLGGARGTLVSSSPEGLQKALHIAANGEYSVGVEFDAQAYVEASVEKFTSMIS